MLPPTMQLHFRDLETDILPPKLLELRNLDEVKTELKARERTYTMAVLTVNDVVKQAWVRHLGKTEWIPQKEN